MSNTPKSRKIDPDYWSARKLIALVSVVLLAVWLLFILQRRSDQVRARWPETPVRLQGTRIVLMQVRETKRLGTVVVYQAQANVRYWAEQKSYDLWLPILDSSDNKKLLQWEMNSLKSKRCYVHWKPKQPEGAFLACV
jgi:hypothetical protein